MTEKIDKKTEKALRELAMDAQDSVGTVVELVDTVHRHKLAAKTSQVALDTEVYNLKQKHKSLKKGSQALVKSQRKGKSGPLGGIAREITATLFPSKHLNGVLLEEKEKASAPPMDAKEGENEAPPSYEEPDAEAQANVTSAEVDAARQDWMRKSTKAADQERDAEKRAQEVAEESGSNFATKETREVANALRRAQKAWEKSEEARIRYHQLQQEFNEEEQQLRRAAGECGPAQPGQEEQQLAAGECGPAQPGPSCKRRGSNESTPSVEVIHEHRDGRKQVVIRDQPEGNPDLGYMQKQGSLYPTLDWNDEQCDLTFGGMPIPKKDPHSTPKETGRVKDELVTTNNLPMGAQNQLRIQDIRRVVIALIPGSEIPWVVLTKQAVARVKPGEETMLLQALMPQLSSHPEVAAQATMLLVQAANNPEKGREVLDNLFQWMQSRYQLTPRQKRTSFIQKLRNMQWNWDVNPADVLTGIMTTSQLTWDEVLKNPSLREELEAIMVSKMDISLHLQITKQDPKKWRQAITEIWEKVKDNVGMKPVEIYMHEGEEDSDSDEEDMACNVEMPSAAVAQASLPKGKTKIDFRNFDKKLDMVVSALQAQEISKPGKPSQQPTASVPQLQPMMSQNPSLQTNAPGQMPMQVDQGQRPPIRCYWCNQEGHIKRNCPQRNNQGFGNGYPGRGGWNAGRGSGRGNWNGGRGGYNTNRNNWSQNRGYGNGYNQNWNNGPPGQGRGGYQNQNPQYRGYRRNGNEQNANQMQINDKPTWESEAARVRQAIIQEGRPKASWAEPPPPPADDQPAIAADHAEANFVQGLSASERWKSETLRPPLMYEQAMAQLAENAPMLQPMDLPSVDFLGQK